MSAVVALLEAQIIIVIIYFYLFLTAPKKKPHLLPDVPQLLACQAISSKWKTGVGATEGGGHRSIAVNLKRRQA